MLTEIDILKDVSSKLDQLGFPYMLTGSMAMNYYAVPRMTRDIDIVIVLPLAMVSKLTRALDADYMIVEEAVQEAARSNLMFNAIHQDSIIKVDFICQKQTPFHEEEFDRRIRAQIEDFESWIVTAEDLILSKLLWMKASESEQQRRDIENLLTASRDQTYLKTWAAKLGVDSLLETF
jgi:hypothetical protein